jgi:hypothetical protein
MRTYIVNWQGPYNDEDLNNIDDNLGLYLITGYQKHKKTELIQYCGITEQNFATRLNSNHHKKELITRNRKFWIGKIKSDKKIIRDDLEIVEKLIVYFWQPVLNEKKKYSLPSPTVVINRWYDTNGNLRKRITHEAQKLHDVIFWDGMYWHLSDRLRLFTED